MSVNPNYMKLVNETRRSAQDTPVMQPMIKNGSQDIPSIYMDTIEEKQKKTDFLADLKKSVRNTPKA